MTTATKTRKTRASDRNRATVAQIARSKGGEGSSDTDSNCAAPIQTPGECAGESENAIAGHQTRAGGVAIADNEWQSATQPANQGSEGESGCDDDTSFVPHSRETLSEGERFDASEESSASRSQSTGGVEGERRSDSDLAIASRRRKTRQTKRPLNPNGHVSGPGDDECLRGSEASNVIPQIQEAQRRRTNLLKVRIAGDNQLAAVIASEMGYRAGLEEAERKSLRAEATKLIAALDAGEPVDERWANVVPRVASLVSNSQPSRDGFDAELKIVEKLMVELAKQLPVAEWCNTVRGFGLKSLAVIVGEAGNLSNYPNPAKLWKRLGCAPITSNGKTQMPSTWRRKGGLSAEEWTTAGYNPRRRSLMYVIGECLLKQNNGAYRARYDQAKAAKLALASDEWPKLRCHKHAMLMAGKLLILNLWLVWNGKPPKERSDALQTTIGKRNDEFRAIAGEGQD